MIKVKIIKLKKINKKKSRCIPWQIVNITTCHHWNQASRDMSVLPYDNCLAFSFSCNASGTWKQQSCDYAIGQERMCLHYAFPLSITILYNLEPLFRAAEWPKW
jgi:hypothetical protein